MYEHIELLVSYLTDVWQKYDSPLKKYQHSKGKSAFQVLVSTILSLRTKDEITYPVAEKLFRISTTPEDFINMSLEELEKVIYPVGFYKTKAKVIKKISEIVKSKYNGEIPSSLEELLSLPGVGRKTANLVLSYHFGIDAICVDVHVHRISNRLGIVRTKTPQETEFKLMEEIPRKYWKDLNHLFVHFGQTICKPRNPKCDQCELKKICKFYNSKNSSP